MQNSSKQLEINSVLELLRLLTNRNISQAEVGEALNTTRSNISLRCKNKSLITTEELIKINKHFNVNIKENTDIKKNMVIEKIKKEWCLSDIDIDVLLPILENKNTRAITKMLFKVLKGDTEATEALIGILKMPEIAKTFIE